MIYSLFRVSKHKNRSGPFGSDPSDFRNRSPSAAERLDAYSYGYDYGDYNMAGYDGQYYENYGYNSQYAGGLGAGYDGFYGNYAGNNMMPSGFMPPPRPQRFPQPSWVAVFQFFTIPFYKSILI